MKNEMIPISEINTVLGPATQDAEKVFSLVTSTPITSNDGLETAVKWTALIKLQAEELDEKRTSFTKPLREVLDNIQAMFKPPMELLARAEGELKKRISAFVVERGAARDKLLTAGGQEPDAAKQEIILAQAAECQIPKVAGMSVRESWGGTVTDEQVVIKWAVENGRYELLSINESALKAIVKGLGRDPQIPGFTVVVNRSVAITPGKVQK